MNPSILSYFLFPLLFFRYFGVEQFSQLLKKCYVSFFPTKGIFSVCGLQVKGKLGRMLLFRQFLLKSTEEKIGTTGLQPAKCAG